MSGLTDRHFFALAVLLYGCSSLYSIFLWRKGFRQDDRVNYLLLLAGLGFQMIAMGRRGFAFDRCPVNNLYEATLFVAWAIAAAYMVMGLLPRLRFLGAFAAPVLLAMGVFALMPGLDQPGPKQELRQAWSSLHASLILLAYGAFGLSSVAALMYLSQERDLKLHRLRAILALMPPIQRLERVIERLMVAGLVLLTVGLVLGAGWLKLSKGVYLMRDTKIIWSAFVWLLYVGLLIYRWRFARGGRRLAWGAFGSFCFILLTFWGSNLLSGIHNP